MRSVTAVIGITSLCLMILMVSVPVSAVSGTNETNGPSISINATPASPVVGDIVTISGTARGGDLTPGVRLWIFAGNYVNVTNVPIDSKGNFKETINTTGYPPAYYYLFVQHPGSDTKFNINVSGYSGEVVNENTGAVIFNFTGNGSLQDNAAAVALSNALNQNGVDDLFAKTGVTLKAPGGSQGSSVSGTPGLQATLVTGNASPTTQAPDISPTTVTSAVPSLSSLPATTTSLPTATRTPLPIEVLFVSLAAGFVLIGSHKRMR
jgi:hypothetical protein